MNKMEFDFFVSLLKEKVGWHISDKDIALISNKLDNFMRKNAIQNYEQLIAQIKKNSKLFLWQIIESIAPSNTSFCRNYSVFKGFEDNLLPHLLELNNSTKRLKILSIGCSNGQELYSAAMSIRKKLGEECAKWKIDMLGLDISTDAIVKAQKGYYTEFEIQHGLNARDIINFFKYEGRYWQAISDLVNMLEFRRFNLYRDNLSGEKYDIILCRNVLDLYEGNDQRHLLRKIGEQLVDGGFLILGLGENLEGLGEYYDKVTNLECIYKVKDLANTKKEAPLTSVGQEMPSFSRPDALKLTNKILTD